MINKKNQNCHSLTNGLAHTCHSLTSDSEEIRNLNQMPYLAHAQGMTGECGRSMVEMLGVLAVIGVLSVGGIAGYKMAMTKHQANELLNEASKRAVVVAAKIAAGQPTNINEFDNNKVGDVTISLNAYTTGSPTFSFKLETVDEAVCSQMKNIISADSQNPKISDDANCATLTYNADLGEGSGNAESCTLTAEKCASGSLVSGECACAPAIPNVTECSSWTENVCGEGMYCKFTSPSETTSGHGKCTKIKDIDTNYTTSSGDGTLDWFSSYSWCKGKGSTMIKYTAITCDEGTLTNQNIFNSPYNCTPNIPSYFYFDACQSNDLKCDNNTPAAFYIDSGEVDSAPRHLQMYARCE